MESTTYLKNVKVSPTKIRIYLAQVKKLTPSEALLRLYYGRQKASKILYKAIQSAISNAASTLKVGADLLDFKILTIEEGIKLKRYRPGSRGNVNPIKRRTSHIKIVLKTKVGAVPKIDVKPKLETKKLEVKKTTTKKQNGTKS